MKKQIFTIFLSLLIIASSLLAACTADKLTPSPPTAEDGGESSTVNYGAQIRALEERILALQQSQYANDAEQQKELAALIEQLQALKAESESAGTENPDDGKNETPTPDAPRFLYTVTNGKATITGYTGNETRLVIPSAIDGYAVYGIADGAFSSRTLKSVTLSSGICRIDWFAFCECENLESVTVPSTVTSIGYAAFPMNSKTLTLYCHSGSFAQSYAQSYGLNYTVI